MARKIIHQLVDDIDGETLEPGEGATVSFAWDGRTYEIDLSNAHTQELRESLAPYIAVARKVAAGNAARMRQRSGLDLGAIRAWARENGYTVSDRGRVPESIIAAFNDAH